MPLFYLRQLTATERTESGNRHLARYLAFVAGAANAGGLLAVHQYTSHMSGIVSAIADNIAVGSLTLAFDGCAAVHARKDSSEKCCSGQKCSWMPNRQCTHRGDYSQFKKVDFSSANQLLPKVGL
jgi:hypothetical protein